MPNGCPNCEFQIQFRAMKEEALAEIHKDTRDADDNLRWPIEYLLETLDVVTQSDALNPRRYHRRWSVVTTTLVAIYRGEHSKARSIENWRLNQQMKSMRRSHGSGYGPEYDSDDEY